MCKNPSYFVVIRRFGWYVTTLNHNTRSIRSWFRTNVGKAMNGYTIEFSPSIQESKAVNYKKPAEISDQTARFFPNS